MKMIIVDDERIGREGLLDFIDWSRDYGIKIVGTAANGQEGYELYRSVRPDIVLTDIKMPIMSGIEMAEKIRAGDKIVKIVFLSAYSDFTYAQKALKTRIDDYLLKPVEEAELRKMMDRIADEKMEQTRRDYCKKYFVDILAGKPDLCVQLREYSFQVFLLGKEPVPKIDGHGLWLMEFHDGANVGIAKYESGEEAVWNGRSAREVFGFCYAGRCVDRPEEIRRSYNEAVLSQYFGSFWELEELEYSQIVKLREQWGRHEAEMQHELVKLANDIRAAISGCDRSRVEAAVHRTMRYLAQNQGIDPASIEDFIMRLVTRIAEEFHDNETRNSLWELRVSLQGRNQFRKIKGILIDWLINLTDTQEEKRKQSETSIVQRVIQIIEEEYERDIGLRTIAERVYLSPNYLGNIFRNATGMYFIDYLARHRMKKATELLLSGPDKVTKIGEAVGIPNTSYFSSLFKKTFGITPKEYRRNNQKQQ
ncbi:YesN/AraC family two-component response regulator [Fontibacillus phaseoli]|uniref:YesN/AraC family two-component response regulator n=1 Tax=Fontibacillus phaseoli TaxID=1416533 RepID=A0A369BKC3_9BACL|nr:response regulator [Fontibacillus phaseoli]RCX21565.1 YesN/AraC family two-component response regulator [Fontibacillus phaseoli]